jgi:hypothetical protein
MLIAHMAVALLVGALSFVVLWQYGALIAFIGTPFVASTAVALGAVLMARCSRPVPAAEPNRAQVKLES